MFFNKKKCCIYAACAVSQTPRYHNELRGLAEDVNQMADSIELEEQKKNEFLTNISHDIRTPLTTILGYLDMIRNEKYSTKEELEEYLKIMERKGIFLASMLDDFFEYSKLASNDVAIHMQLIEVNELLRQFHADELEEFCEKGLELQLVLAEQPMICKVDVELMVRAIGNLLSNALKYAKHGTTVILQSVECTAEHNIQHFNQSNKEKGIIGCNIIISNVPKAPISEHDIKQLFERMYRQDSARSGEGSGLGLSIAKNIVKLYQGSLMAYKEGERICFKIYIDVANDIQI